MYRAHRGWGYNVDAPPRPPLARGGFLRAAWTPLPLRRLWALSNLALAPEPAATAALRALARLACGGAGAALFGLAGPHTHAPDPSPLLNDPTTSAVLRLGWVVGSAVWGGRPPHPAWISPPPGGAATPRPSRRPTPPDPGGGYTTMWTTKTAGPGAGDWWSDSYEGSSYAFRLDTFYRTYTRGRAEVGLVGRPTPEWGGELTSPGRPPLPPSPRNPYPTPPDLTFTYRPAGATGGPRPRLLATETSPVPVPHYRYRYPLRHRWERGTFRWGTTGRTHNAGYPTYTKEVCGEPCWELAPWKCRPFFTEGAPHGRGHTWVGASQLDTGGRVGGLPYYEDGVPIRRMPGAGAHPTLGATEERTRWEPSFSYPHPHRGWQGAPDRSFQRRLDRLAADIHDKLLIHRGLGLNPETTEETGGMLTKIGEVGYLQARFEGQTFERSGPLAYTRPPGPAHPPAPL